MPPPSPKNDKPLSPWQLGWLAAQLPPPSTEPPRLGQKITVTVSRNNAHLQVAPSPPTGVFTFDAGTIRGQASVGWLYVGIVGLDEEHAAGDDEATRDYLVAESGAQVIEINGRAGDGVVRITAFFDDEKTPRRPEPYGVLVTGPHS